eukprot:CAMPEP_0172510442 /NCGR_PEP_ID=MMETSP1066-20121228/228481_1 /TAXON_ID=671091 /ORGANISM="Coscinodiscus wailesii, Strain CCMP2513" /LENGTH=56 /DNA_ID=CAMNT_0013289373 /DNA_START=299 /DNA_END=472 /DNA_ORIENTATION=-
MLRFMGGVPALDVPVDWHDNFLVRTYVRALAETAAAEAIKMVSLLGAMTRDKRSPK